MIRHYARSIPAVYKAYKNLQFFYYQYHLHIANKQDRGNPLDQHSIPYPPAKLRWRVHGDFGLQGFVDIGQKNGSDIIDALARNDKRLADFNNILDFGCGCGRVIRHLHRQSQASQFIGTDIDHEAVSWCQENLPPNAFYTNDFQPPTRFADGQFDFIYAVSVFSHLDEDMQFAWLHELKRITRVGGIILLSVHGPACYRQFTPIENNTLKTKGFLFCVSQTGPLKMDGLPDFYQTTYHSKEYIQREWGKIFTLLDYVEKGINDHQDAVLLLRG